MELLQHRPGAPLSRYVHCLWMRRGWVSDPHRSRALPTGGADLTFNLADEPLQVYADARDAIGDTFAQSVVHGPQSRYFVLGARRSVHVYGVHLRPGGALLLGVGAHELKDRHVSLDALWGREASSLRDRLVEAPTPQAGFLILEAALLRRLWRARQVHPAVSFALRSIQSQSGLGRIGQLREASGYGERRFTQAFALQVGLGPKLFSRIVRMSSLVQRVFARGRVDWAQAADEFGYVDQAHLTHEFRRFAGVTPAAYRPQPGASALHMALQHEPPER